MNRLLDKSALLLICITALSLSGNAAGPVIVLLCTVTASATVQLLSGTKTAAAIIALVSAACLVYPLFFCIMPIVLYDALCEKKWWLSMPASLILFSAPNELTPLQCFISAAGITAAILIYIRVSALEKTVSNLTELRDKVTETNLQLSHQNSLLAEAQDNEIRLATLRERNRIAREIHDNVGHMLTRSLLQSGALLIINKDEQLKEPLTSLRDTLDTAMTSIRESVHNLHDDSVDLKKLISESLSAAEGKFRTSLEFDISENISGSIKFCIAGIVKECVSNAIKHSSGSELRVIVREHPMFYQLMVDDNGCCKESIKETGIGLKNMRERAESSGGRITFTPSPDGFRVFMTIPKK